MVAFEDLFEFFLGCFRPGGELRVGEMGDRCGDVDALILIGFVVSFGSTGLVDVDSCLMDGEEC